MASGVFEEVRQFLREPDDARFGELALRVFRFQYEGSPPYRRFCDRRGITPGAVTRWEDIPAVPVSAFKQADLEIPGFPEGRVFLTSGTTEGTQRRGRHRVPDPSIYREAALLHFRDMVLPDDARPRFVVLAPSSADAPESSLCQMIDWLAGAFGTGEPVHVVPYGTLDVGRLAETLREMEGERDPVLLIGLTYAFVQFLDAMRIRDVRFRLPYASRIVDTGGTKGRVRALSRNGLLRAFWEGFGIAGYWVANEYGMTEMCSQFYDSSIRDHFRGRKRDRVKVGPRWVRTQIVSPETLVPVSRGERGLLRHFDLANVGSVSMLQTEDVGIAPSPEGFEITGRARGAELRGCALLLDEVRS